MQEFAGLLPLLLVFLVFYFLFIRPQSKRRRETMQMQNELAAGTEVMLTSGLYGTITQIVDDRIELAIADGVVVTVHRQAVGQVVPPPSVDDELDADASRETPTSTSSSDSVIEER